VKKSGESLEKRTGEQLVFEIILNAERNRAKDLGNYERFEAWGKAKCFGIARREWFGAWKRFYKGKRLSCLFDIREGVLETLEPEKAFTLASLRWSEQPEEILRKRATVVRVAAMQGDVRFFEQLGQVLINRERTKREDAFLGYSILLYWFAGNLWLMNEKAGAAALCAYTKRDITKAAYRSACRRLGLKGHRDRMRHPPFGYDAVSGIYEIGW